ncbi:ABC transporter substrate-binding protein [Cohnella zeiphila]|uniref:Carbohydrate ABC transporter substrate-binding protein n=1 Tax=Cohnella zeiphila TaxID=2761120 RepID=A0A7X0SGC2_9BACL|nr:ABC transporter substrate-binding protein [Cohnella zeiphila]MBB6729462.1 carbohydrate ABC transporter substrate-binding protein [Cohnella zeiphila]
MQSKTKRTSALLLASALAVSLTACGSNSGSNAGSGGGSSASSGSGGKVTIELAISKSSQDSAFVNEDLLKKFEDQTNIHVNLQLLPAEQTTTVLQTKLAVGDTPDLVQYNLAGADSDLNLSRNFEILDNEAWTSRILNKDVLSADGHVYSFHVSQDTGMQGVVYNKDIFKELGLSIPKNYDEFLAVCEKIKAKGITPIFMPFKDAWATNIWPSAALADYASKSDPNLWQDLNSGKRKWSDVPELETIVNQQYDLFKKGYTNADVLSDSYDMAVGKFLDKEVAMMFMGDWLIQDVVNKDSNMHLGLFPIPYADNVKMGASPMGGQLFIPKKSKHMAEAKKFLDFLASQEVAQQIVNEQKYVSNFNDVKSPELPEYKQEIVDNYITPKNTVTTMEAYMLVDYTEMYRDYQDVYAGSKSAKEAIAAWDKKFQQLMKDKGIAGFN